MSRLTQTVSDRDTWRKRRRRSGAWWFSDFEKQRGRKQPRVEPKRVCVCVCARDRKNGRKGGREMERGEKRRE